MEIIVHALFLHPSKPLIEQDTFFPKSGNKLLFFEISFFTLKAFAFHSTSSEKKNHSFWSNRDRGRDADTAKRNQKYMNRKDFSTKERAMLKRKGKN